MTEEELTLGLYPGVWEVINIPDILGIKDGIMQKDTFPTVLRTVLNRLIIPI